MATATDAMFNLGADIGDHMDNWGTNVSLPVPDQMSLADSNSIIAELSLFGSKFDGSRPESSTSPRSCASLEEFEVHSSFPQQQVGAGIKRCAPAPVTSQEQAFKKLNMSKIEPVFAVSEPVTPHTVFRSNSAHNVTNQSGFSVPLSPICQSLCSEEDDDIASSLPPSPVPADMSAGFPTPSKDQATKRRAIRLAALKRSRSRRDEGSSSMMCNGRDGSSADLTKAEDELVGSVEPMDKKAARAIRNREAAMKSRVEAKQRMRRLEEDNGALAVRVKKLGDANRELNAQLRTLLSHTLGVQVNDNQDVQAVFAAFSQMNATAAIPASSS